jgi:hypothetical protein
MPEWANGIPDVDTETDLVLASALHGAKIRAGDHAVWTVNRLTGHRVEPYHWRTLTMLLNLDTRVSSWPSGLGWGYRSIVSTRAGSLSSEPRNVAAAVLAANYVKDPDGFPAPLRDSLLAAYGADPAWLSERVSDALAVWGAAESRIKGADAGERRSLQDEIYRAEAAVGLLLDNDDLPTTAIDSIHGFLITVSDNGWFPQYLTTKAAQAWNASPHVLNSTLSNLASIRSYLDSRGPRSRDSLTLLRTAARHRNAGPAEQHLVLDALNELNFGATEARQDVWRTLAKRTDLDPAVAARLVYECFWFPRVSITDRCATLHLALKSPALSPPLVDVSTPPAPRRRPPGSAKNALAAAAWAAVRDLLTEPAPAERGIPAWKDRLGWLLALIPPVGRAAAPTAVPSWTTHALNTPVVFSTVTGPAWDVLSEHPRDDIREAANRMFMNGLLTP